MIVLDTHVVSELMRRDPRVMAWIAEQPMAGVMFTTTLTQAEIVYGLALLPEGRRGHDLLAAARACARPVFDGDLAGRVLPRPLVYPEIAAGRKLRGKPISQIDAQIAAIMRSRGWRLATSAISPISGSRSSIPWGEAWAAAAARLSAPRRDKNLCAGRGCEAACWNGPEFSP